MLTLIVQLVESEKVAENSQSRCKEQGIPFYRFSPLLKNIIPAGETDNEKLLNMVIETKVQIGEQELKEMIEQLRIITVTSKDVSETSSAPSAEQNVSSEKGDHFEQKQFLQVPQFSITTEPDQQEENTSQMNDRHNEMLNEALVHPTGVTVGDNMPAAAADFKKSDGREELDNGQFPRKHYQLDVDGQESNQHQPRNSSYLLETPI